jgi:hypothetical protein
MATDINLVYHQWAFALGGVSMRSTSLLTWAVLATIVPLTGCATRKQSDTARTGVEQLLISTAVDRALDKVDYKPISGAKVFVEEKYLDCVDKNYVFVALHQRLLRNNCTLVAKAEDADVIMEVTSGGVGTDRTDLFVGVTEIPLPPPSPISIPRMSVYNRTRAIGTAKIGLVAYDAKTKLPRINTDPLARSDYKAWTVLGTGGAEGGTLTQEVAAATGDHDSLLDVPQEVAFRKSQSPH